VKDIYGGHHSSVPNPQVVVGSDLYLIATNASAGTQVWKTDGTSAGTVQVSDIDPGSNAGIAAPIVTLGGKLYFSAFDAGHGYELWRNSGSTGSGLLLKDIWPGPNGSAPSAPCGRSRSRDPRGS
jgi:ELWxxDGT repeat protein